ncbi:transcriptional repressor [Leucobacter weissii]|uniref:Transcriptional repressor n=1 Tax=Leucobacter weissii TaxID=1983706 RepID=A0A939MIC8_9MICO|nr:transcriptional repressor [Leucobacter weissii]MBO1901469.1 transcriptional repressor [Leucobacter weissii]
MRETETSSQPWADELRTHGLRVTAGRIAALGHIEAHPHCSAAEIHSALVGGLPSLSQQSVHNIVGDLTECGILRRIDLPDAGSALYETRTRDNHHHVQCVSCHRVEDVDCAVGAAPCLNPDHSHGMRILEASVTFRGICADCEAAEAAGASREAASAAEPSAHRA